MALLAALHERPPLAVSREEARQTFRWDEAGMDKKFPIFVQSFSAAYAFPHNRKQQASISSHHQKSFQVLFLRDKELFNHQRR